MRPYLTEFLFIISKLFEVYIYTKGTRYYADEICRWVRAQWAGDPMPYEMSTWPDPPQTFLKNTECFLPYRVVSRNEDSSLETKSMQNILPNRSEYHIILDDRRDVWANSPSWYYTR
jgi:TFIIF-interacting CTD phosphatase-like protein